MRRRLAAILSLAILSGILANGCKKDDGTDDRLKQIRLFSMDVVADMILELDAKSGRMVQSFLAPGGEIRGPGCGLAYDPLTQTLFFHDSNIGDMTIWSIKPDDPDPFATAVALPTPAPATDYVGLAHDGTYLMALRQGQNGVDWLNPVTGDFVLFRDYSTAIMPGSLDEGLDASETRLFAAGDDGTGVQVITELDFAGGVIQQLVFTIPGGGVMPRGLGYARSVLFVADMGNVQILVIDMRTGEKIDDFRIQGATSVCGLAAGPK